MCLQNLLLLGVASVVRTRLNETERVRSSQHVARLVLANATAYRSVDYILMNFGRVH